MLIYDHGLREMTPEEIAELEASEREDQTMADRLSILERCMEILLGEDLTDGSDRSSEEETTADGQGQ